MRKAVLGRPSAAKLARQRYEEALKAKEQDLLDLAGAQRMRGTGLALKDDAPAAALEHSEKARRSAEELGARIRGLCGLEIWC